MSTVLLKNQFVEYDGKSKVALENLSVEIHMGEKSEITRVPLSNLWVKTGEKNGTAQTRKVKSYADFVKNLKVNNIFTSALAMQNIRHGFSNSHKMEVQVKGIDVPSTVTSISENKAGASSTEKLPYGIRRRISVKEATPKDDATEVYLLVEVDGKQEFVKKNEIYYYNSGNQKTYFGDIKGDLKKFKDVTFYTKDGKPINLIYTEKEYVFDKVVANDTVDLAKGEKTTYEFVDKVNDELKKLIQQELEVQALNKTPKNNFEIEHKGVRYNVTLDNSNNFVQAIKYTTKPINKYFSEQEYVRTTIEDDKNPGKEKEISQIKVRNFEIRPDGEYFSITIKGATKMVKLEDVVDENDNPIRDMRTMIGKVVKVKQGKDVIATSAPLTYEQAHFAYSTIKTYQETEKEAGEDTYLRLKNGVYVKELETVKPISYKVVNLANAPYDAFLVKTTDAEGKEKFVIVSRDYFEKHGDTSELKRENAYRIKRCEFSDKDCSIVQTTSKGAEIEQCAIVKKTKFTENVQDDAKDVAYQGFMAGYLKGEYKVADVYQNGKVEELSIRGQRYEYSDTHFMDDYADRLHQYQSLKVNQIQIENGKIVGGPKFSISKGIKNSYKTLGKTFLSTYGIAIAAGIFIPVVGPVVAAAQVVASVAAIPLIPVVNAVYGAVKNHQKTTFADKSEINREKLINDLEKRIQKLYERQTTKDHVPYPEARFEDEYAKLVNDIITLSASSVNNTLKVVNGVAEVTPENARAAKAYMQEFNSVSERLETSAKELKRTKEAFDKLDAKMKYYDDEGLVVPAKFQQKFEASKQAYEKSKRENKELTSKREALMNYEGNPLSLQQDQECERLLALARTMRTTVYFKTFKDNPLVHEALYGEKGLTDSSDLLTEEDLSLQDKKWTKEELEEIRKNYYSEFSQEEFEKYIKEDPKSRDKKLTPEEIKAYREQYAKKSMSMLENMELDFKNGLMVDGIGVSLNDEEMSRTPEYARGYQWAKVKQAIEFVHNGLNGAQRTSAVYVEPIVPEEPAIEPKKEKPKPKEEDNSKKSKRLKNKNEIFNSESMVVVRLEDGKDDEIYKLILRGLKRKGGKYEMEEKAAVLTINDVIEKIKATHDEGKCAIEVFEKDSIEYKILEKATKEHAKRVQQFSNQA